jgi:transcriptional regulator with AAA-type ATPase domain/regulation of enolase protein 1 (concanavalin A-like superfamily)
LVGRDGEWAAVVRRCQCARRGEGGLLLLSGEAGIGKTALLRGLRDWALAAGYRVIWGQHPDLPMAPAYHGLRQAMGQLLEIASGDGPAVVDTRLRTALQASWAQLRVHRRAIIGFLRPSDEPPIRRESAPSVEDRAERLHDLLHRLLLAKAQEAPLLVLLDDCHWADTPSLQAVAYLAGLLATAPVLLVLTYRPDEQTPAMPSLADLAGRRQTDTVAVSRLSAGQVGHLLDRLGGDASTAAVVSLHRLTEGVPLYVEQFLELYGEAGMPLSDESLAAPLPRRIIELFERRLLLLSPDEAEVIRAAAVAGDPFSSDLVGIALERPSHAVLEPLAGLESRGLVHSRFEPLSTGEGFAFHHPLLRRVVYERMPGATRQQLHGRLAAALAAVCAEQPEFLFATAHHYRAAGAAERGAEVLLHAGRRALSLGAVEDAKVLLGTALTTAGAGRRELRADCETALGDALEQSDDPEAAFGWWQTALEHRDDPQQRAALLVRQAGVTGDVGGWPLLQRALRETETVPDSPERCETLTRLTNATSPDASLNRRYAVMAIQLLRRRPDPSAWVRLLVLLVNYRDGRRLRLGRRRRLLRRALRFAHEAESWTDVIDIHRLLAQSSLGPNLDRAVTEMEAAYRLAQAYLPPNSLVSEYAISMLVGLNLARGQVEQARRLDAQRSGRGPILTAAADLDFYPAEAAWQEALEQVRHVVARNQAALVDVAAVLSRLQHVAARLGRQVEADAFLAELRAQYPTASMPSLMTACPAPWGPPATGPAVPGVPGPGFTALGLGALVWRPVGSEDRQTPWGMEGVEIQPGPLEGLGAAGVAPCLLTEVSGDFTLEVRVQAAGTALFAGGVVVFSRPGLLRLGCGIDHVGQVSLCRAGDIDRCCHALGDLGEGPVWLRLRRRGRVYTALASRDQQAWYACGETEFGPAGPVEVGLFAECSHARGFGIPYPVRFTNFGLWAAREAAGADGQPTVAPGAATGCLPGAPEPAPTPVPRGVGGSGPDTDTRSAPDASGQASPPLFPLPPAPVGVHGMVGAAPLFRRFVDNLERLAGTASSVLITGETGTGKELAAHALHALSARHRGPFVPLNVAALAPELVESELFGYRRGAFTGADDDRPGLFVAAAAGTLFLDEIGELPLPHQAKLLRVLDHGEVRPVGATHARRVDVRCLAATNRDLRRAVADGTFRADLLYRLGQQLTVPPLRSRREDLPLLVAHILTPLCPSGPPAITTAAMAALAAHDWPGNVRELRAVLEGALARADDQPLAVEHLQLGDPAEPAMPPRPRGRTAPSAAELARLLRACGGDVQALSRHCGVSRNTVYRWFRQHQLDPASLR